MEVFTLSKEHRASALGVGPIIPAFGRRGKGSRFQSKGWPGGSARRTFCLQASTHLELEFQGTQRLLLAANSSCLHVVCISSWRYIPIINQSEEQFQFILGYVVDPVLSKRKDRES